MRDSYQKINEITRYDKHAERNRAIVILNKFKNHEKHLIEHGKLNTYYLDKVEVQSLETEKNSRMCKYIKNPYDYGNE